ncbi:MAG: hypothetical protein OXE52_18485 [Chloroflexi bacterium]|nr:hypothetical protein [Chloroflexota bacterium]
MSVALISSLYRCEPHLSSFTAAVFGFAKQVSEAGVSVHYLPIANDASDYERTQINLLTREINANYYGRMTPVYVSRESLYASWNRGVAASQTPYIAFWNADDVRSTEGFIEGIHALQGGTNLVDFPFTQVSAVRRLGVFPQEQRLDVARLFDPVSFGRGNGLGPFFMMSRALYQRVGPFDEAFRVAGDMEWAGRALAHARFHAGQSNGGDFLIHGDNLSNTGGDREDIEVNIIFLRRGEWRHLRPVHPRAQKDAWHSWGNTGGVHLPGEIEDFLWGTGAQERWRQYQRERRQGRVQRRIRLALAARGLWRSAEWSVYQRNQQDSL